MAESIVEQILASIKAELEAITEDNGTTYWYTPSQVIRVDYFSTTQHFPANQETIYMIQDTGDEEENADSASMAGMADDLDVFIVLATQDTRADKNPFTASTLSGTIRNRMVKDLRKKLEADWTRGSLAFDTSRWSTRRDTLGPDGWICAEVHFVVSYEHTRGAP